MNTHERIQDDLEQRLRQKYPKAHLERNVEWKVGDYQGEIDLIVYLTNGWRHWYEVKSNHTHRASHKAMEQAHRFRGTHGGKYKFVYYTPTRVRRLRPEE